MKGGLEVYIKGIAPFLDRKMAVGAKVLKSIKKQRQ
jgi:hypothetical protein